MAVPNNKPRLRRLLNNLKAFLAFVITFPAISILLLLLVFLLIWRYCAILLVKIFRKNFIGILDARDTFFASDGIRDKPSIIMPGCLIMKGSVNFEKVRDWFDSKLIPAEKADGTLKYPKLRQIQKFWLGFWWWQWSPNFNINDHVRICEEVQGKDVVTQEDLLELIGEISNKPFLQDKPCWEFLYVPKYRYHSEDKEEKSLFVYRVSHSYCDGYSLLKMVISSLAEESLDNLLPHFPTPETKLIDSIFFYIYMFFMLPYLYLQQRSVCDNNSLHFSRKNYKDEWVAAMSDPIPLSLFKQIKKKHGLSFQSIIVSALSSALTKYMKEKKMKIPNKISIAMPFPWPSHPNDTLVNHWTGGCYSVELDKGENITDLIRNDEMVRDFNTSPSLVSNYWTTKLVCLLPTWLSSPLCLQRGSTLILSNVAGPSKSISLFGGYRMEDIVFWVCLARGLAGIGVSCLSYAGRVRIALMADKLVIPDRQSASELCDSISLSLNNLLNSNLDFEPDII